jgi:thiamine pyrophosphokinase
MRALVVAAARSAGSVGLVAQLAQTHDLVIAADGGGEICRDAGVTPGVLVGDFDSIAPDVHDVLARSGSEIVSHPADKDETDLELALAQAVHRGATQVTVTAASTGRLDHTLGTLAAIALVAGSAPLLREPDLAGWLLSPDGRTSIALDGVGGVVSLVAWGGPAIASASGLRWPLAREALAPTSARTLSNVIDAPSASITVHSGLLWVLAPYIEGVVRVSER